MSDLDWIMQSEPTRSEEKSVNALTVSKFLSQINQTLDLEFHPVTLIGEVASFKINQGKWVFFDLKEDSYSLSCFLPLYQLRTPLEDGMKILVKGYPKVTNWGKFSFTVSEILPVGEGSIKKGLELLKAKLEKEGLFSQARKRPLPDPVQRLAVISSTQAAGYADFIKILNERWGGLDIKVAHTAVQGLGAADQIIRALQYFNEQGTADVIAIVRGGGSQDDLAVFNDEALARAIAASKIPVITGIGHEVDESLADLVADVRASTPSNAAQFLTRDRRAEIANLKNLVSRLHVQIVSKLTWAETDLSSTVQGLHRELSSHLDRYQSHLNDTVEGIHHEILSNIDRHQSDLSLTIKTLDRLNPDKVLKQGYSILTGRIAKDSVVKITTLSHDLEAKIIKVKERKL